MDFTGEIATIQQRLAACHEMAAGTAWAGGRHRRLARSDRGGDAGMRRSSGGQADGL
jgi:hypothetical protein